MYSNAKTMTIISSVLICFIIEVISAQTKADVLLDAHWGSQFTLSATEAGEQMTVSAIASDEHYIYLYDMSDRSIIRIDSLGAIISRTGLESIGRATYVGDDFIIRDNQAIFLNAVDFRLEYFDCTNGSHLRSIAYPSDFLKNPKRSKSIINRIFLDGNTIILGNNYSVFPFNENGKLQKSKIISFPKDKKILLYHSRKAVEEISGQTFWNNKNVSIKRPVFHFSGKHIVLYKNMLIQCIVDNTGIHLYQTR